MPALNGDVREHVLRETREEIRTLAREGMSAEYIEQHLNGDRRLTEPEQQIVYLLIHHAVAEARGHY